MEHLFSWLDRAVDWIWFLFGFPALLILGTYFSFRFRFVQVHALPTICRHFVTLIRSDHSPDGRGHHPIQLFFAALGGCIGIGNVVSVCTAVQIGGPGAVFWIWITAVLGSMVKYSEVFLGMRYRRPNDRQGFDGGPVYYLVQAFSGRWVPSLAAALLCIYGVEVYVFHVVVDGFVINWELNRGITTIALLAAVIYGSYGGFGRVGRISSVIVPVFIICFVFLSLLIVVRNFSEIPGLIFTVISSAFKGHAAIGGFIGSTMMMTVAQGVSWGCYSGDIGVGYASAIHSESRETCPSGQASLTILAIFFDTMLICSLTLFVVLITGVWKENISPVVMLQTAMSSYVPGLTILMPILFGLLGYSTLIAFLGVGFKHAEYLGGIQGKQFYLTYAVVAYLVFAFFDPTPAEVLMRTTGALLLCLNVTAFYRLRDEINIVALNSNDKEVSPIHSTGF